MVLQKKQKKKNFTLATKKVLAQHYAHSLENTVIFTLQKRKGKKKGKCGNTCTIPESPMKTDIT